MALLVAGRARELFGPFLPLALEVVLATAIFFLALWVWRQVRRIFQRRPQTQPAIVAKPASSAIASDVGSGLKGALVALFTSISVRRSLLQIRRLGLVGLAVLLSIALSIASFYTTYHGLLNFANSDLIALTAAIGIQGILFVSSWIVARDSAVHANKRRRRNKARQEQYDDIDESDGFWRTALGPLFGGLGYLAAQPFQVVMLVTCLAISVFFSFDALFDQVYQEPQRLLTNRKVARSDIATALAGMHEELVAERARLASTLVNSEDWKKYAAIIDKVAESGAKAKANIEATNNAQRLALEGQIGAARKDFESAGQEVAHLQAQFNADTGAIPAAAVPRVDTNQAQLYLDSKNLAERMAELGEAQHGLDSLKSQADELRVELGVEDKIGGKVKFGPRRLHGQGPAWRELNAELAELNIDLRAAFDTLQKRKDAVAVAQRQVAIDNAKIDEIRKLAQNADETKERVKHSLSVKAGELATLKLNLDDLEKRYAQTSATGAQVADVTKGAFGLVDNMLEAKRKFATSGAAADFHDVVEGCGHLVELLGGTPEGKKDFDPASCESTAVSSNIQAFAAVNKALTYFDETPLDVESPTVASARVAAETSDAAAANAATAAESAARTNSAHATDALADAERLETSAANADADYDAVRATLSCAVDSNFNSFKTIDAFLSRGRYCLGQTHLSAAVVAPQRAIIDRVEQENSRATSHFERTSSSLRRGDALAWLALFIAFSLDFLVLIAAILGERTLMTPLVQDGLLGSKSELEEMTAESNVDTALFPGDPNEIRNYKILVAHVVTESLEARNGAAGLSHSIVDLNRADPNYAAILSMMVNSAATSDPPRAHAVAQRPNVFRIENALMRHFRREIGLWEREHAQLHGPRDADIGETVRPLEGPISRPGPSVRVRYAADNDPFEFVEPLVDAERSSNAQRLHGGGDRNAMQDPDNVVAMSPAKGKWDQAVNNAKSHPDVRSYH